MHDETAAAAAARFKYNVDFDPELEMKRTAEFADPTDNYQKKARFNQTTAYPQNYSMTVGPQTQGMTITGSSPDVYNQQYGTTNMMLSPQFPQQSSSAFRNQNSAYQSANAQYNQFSGNGMNNMMQQYPVAGYQGYGNSFIQQMGGGVAPGNNSIRTVYLGNVPAEATVEDVLNHVRGGILESVRMLPEKNCVFASFLDGGSAAAFHADASNKKITVHGQELKVGWGKASAVPAAVLLAIQTSNASRNVYLGNLDESITEDTIKSDLSKYGPIDTVKMVRDKNCAFVHFLSISTAMKVVQQLPQEPEWQNRRVNYGKDRCAYTSKGQQHQQQQVVVAGGGQGTPFTFSTNGLGYPQNYNMGYGGVAGYDPYAQGSVEGNGMGNRTVYLGNIHPETSTEEICNVIRGGILHHIRYIPEKHIAFVSFIDPNAALAFFNTAQYQGVMIHNRRLKVGWGKNSGPLPAAIGMAVQTGASRNVYIGNIDDSITEEKLRRDFSEYGEIELVNTLREKNCAFVNFTNIANAIKAIDGIKSKEEYNKFRINYGKDRCGNPPRNSNQHGSQMGTSPGLMSAGSGGRGSSGMGNKSRVSSESDAKYLGGDEDEDVILEPGGIVVGTDGSSSIEMEDQN